MSNNLGANFQLNENFLEFLFQFLFQSDPLVEKSYHQEAKVIHHQRVLKQVKNEKRVIHKMPSNHPYMIPCVYL